MMKPFIKGKKFIRGLNGKYVERFYMNAEESYIFKPLTNKEQLGKEIWAYEQVLSFFPDIYPKIIASSSTSDPSSIAGLF